MTLEESIIVLGVGKNSNHQLIEQAYKNNLRKLQLQLTAGQSLSVRKQAEHKISQLENAIDVARHTVAQQTLPLPSQASIPSTIGQPVTSIPTSWWAIPNKVFVYSAGLAAATILLVVLLCAARAAGNKAEFRVFSVPWCYVELDGRALGTSGQVEAFKVTPGVHTITLRTDSDVITKEMEFHKDKPAMLKVKFQDRRAYVTPL